jgi:hypothetical protein
MQSIEIATKKLAKSKRCAAKQVPEKPVLSSSIFSKLLKKSKDDVNTEQKVRSMLEWIFFSPNIEFRSKEEIGKASIALFPRVERSNKT